MESLSTASLLASDRTATFTSKSSITNGLIPDQKYTFHIKESITPDNKVHEAYSKIRIFLGVVIIGDREYVEVERSPCRGYLIAVDKLSSITATQ
jgi:hypothetical protein